MNNDTDMLDQMVHRFKMVLTECSDNELVTLFEQSKAVQLKDDVFWLDNYQYLDELVEQELSQRHPRRWEWYIDQVVPKNSLRYYMLGGE